MLAVVAVAAAVIIPTAVGSTAPQRVRTLARTLFAHAQNARSDAVALGRRVDLEFDLDAIDAAGAPAQVFRARHEADPFGAPGTLEPAPGLFGADNPVGDGVRIMGIEHGPEPGRALGDDREAATAGLITITFCPDGTCQSAAIWIGAGDEDTDQMVVDIDGITGRVRILTDEQIDAERAGP